MTTSQRPPHHTHEGWLDIVVDAWHRSVHRPTGPARLEVHPCTAHIGDTGMTLAGYEVRFTFPPLISQQVSEHRFFVRLERLR